MENNLLDYLMDSTITKSPLVPSIFGQMNPVTKKMVYIAVLAHYNGNKTVFNQSEIPIITLEAAKLLHIKATNQDVQWFPVAYGVSPSDAMQGISKIIQHAEVVEVPPALLRNMVWYVTWFLGQDLLHVSINEAMDSFNIPTLKDIKDMDLDSVHDKMVAFLNKTRTTNQ